MALSTIRTRCLRRVGDKEYHRTELIIPNETVNQLHLPDEQPVEVKVTNGKIVVTPTKTPPAEHEEEQADKPTYEKFRTTIKETLTTIRKTTIDPPTWTQIRRTANWKQQTPPSVWVQRMKLEGGLLLITRKDGQIGWSMRG